MTVPSREDADRLAAALPGDRKGWDGQPLSEKDRRSYALRESGYTGWIDQDGYPATTAAVPVATSENAGNVPSREQADRLAAALPADSRGWDGQPLDDKGRRLYALRDSGWTGPIDQDGYPDTTSEGAGILRRMAQGRGETVDW